MIFHRYKVFISRWGIVFNIYGSIHDYEEYVASSSVLREDSLFEICPNLYVYFVQKNYQAQLHPLDYPHMLDGLRRVETQIMHNAKYKQTLIVISHIEYDPCCMQEEAYVVGMMEWAAKAFAFPRPIVDVSFNYEKNRYEFKL